MADRTNFRRSGFLYINLAKEIQRLEKHKKEGEPDCEHLKILKRIAKKTKFIKVYHVGDDAVCENH